MSSNSVSSQPKLVQIGGWVLVIVGMFLPVLFLITAPRTLVFTFPISCAILVFGLMIVAGRFPRQRA